MTLEKLETNWLRLDGINRKERLSDWEIDTIVGKEKKGAILTATKRKTSFLLMKKLSKEKNAKDLALELFYLLVPYKKWYYLSLPIMVVSFMNINHSEIYSHQIKKTSE